MDRVDIQARAVSADQELASPILLNWCSQRCHACERYSPPASTKILRFKCGSEKRRQLPPVHVFVRRFSRRVVTTGQDHDSMIQMMRCEFTDHLARKLGKKSQIVVSVNDQRLLAIPRELVEIDHRADREPELAQAFEVDGGFDPLANVASGLTVPDYVGKVGGRVIKSGGPNARIVRAGNEGVAGAEARPDQAELVVALLLEPVEAAADIDHALAHGIERASDVGGNGIVCAANLSGHADIVIRHAQAQDCNIQQVENLAEGGIGDGIRVPVGKQNNSPATTGREPAGIRKIVLGVGRPYRRCETEKVCEGSAHFRFELRIGNFTRAEDLHLAALDPEIGWDPIRIKFVARRDDALVVVCEELLRVGGYLPRGNPIAAGPIVGELGTPFEVAHDAIVIDRGEPVFPLVHPFGVARSHVLTLNIAGTCEPDSQDAASSEWLHLTGISSFVKEDARGARAWKCRTESRRERSPITRPTRPRQP